METDCKQLLSESTYINRNGKFLLIASHEKGLEGIFFTFLEGIFKVDLLKIWTMWHMWNSPRGTLHDGEELTLHKIEPSFSRAADLQWSRLSLGRG